MATTTTTSTTLAPTTTTTATTTVTIVTTTTISLPPPTTTTIFINSTTTAAPGNSTAESQTQWEFLLSAFIIMVVATALCGSIIFVCKKQTREAREKREKEEQDKEDERKRFEEELKKNEEEEEKKREEREEQIRREIELQEEIEQARKEGREVDPVYNRDDIFYANVADVPVFVEHPSSLVETGTAALDHTGVPKPRAGDKNYSSVKTTDSRNGMLNKEDRHAPCVMGMKVINGVDFYRNQYDRTVAQQNAREQADKLDQARKKSQPYSYRQMLKSKKKSDGVGLGEDFASGLDGGGGDHGDDDHHHVNRGPNSVIADLPWIGKQNLSAFDPDAFEKAFADLPDDDEQEEIDRKKMQNAADDRSSIHARVTGQVLMNERDVEENERKGYHSRTDGGGGAAMFSLLEAPAARKVRADAEVAAKRTDQLERQKYNKLVDQANKPKKKGQAKFVAPSEPPRATSKTLVVSPSMKYDKEEYFAQML